MLDSADSKKTDDMLIGKLKSVRRKIVTLKAKNEKNGGEIAKLQKLIHKLQASQIKGKNEFVSHKKKYQNFFQSVNGLLQRIREKQKAVNFKQMKFEKQSSKHSATLDDFKRHYFYYFFMKMLQVGMFITCNKFKCVTGI